MFSEEEKAKIVPAYNDPDGNWFFKLPKEVSRELVKKCRDTIVDVLYQHGSGNSFIVLSIDNEEEN